MEQSRFKVFYNSLWKLWKNSKKISYKVSDNPPPLPSFSTADKPFSVALVLGGGGSKGLAHIAVLEEFEKEKIPVDLIVGCSAGSFIGALYADTPDAKRLKSLLINMRKKDFVNISFLHSRFGLGHGNALRKLMKTHMSATEFHKLKIPLIVVAADLQVGELVSLHQGDIIPSVHASCAIPFYFNPVILHDRVLVDGGIIDPIPTTIAKKQKPSLVVAVDLNQTLTPSLPSNLFGVAKRSWEIALYHQSKDCLRDADIVINPQFGNISMFEEGRNQEIYDAGREAAQKAIPEIKEMLYKNTPFKNKITSWF